MAWLPALRRHNPLTLVFVLVEALFITVILALFSYGYPQRSREQLWEQGGINGFNSNPKLQIYFYANHHEPPKIAFIWSQTFTDFNLAVGLITLWIFVTCTMLLFAGVLEKWTHLFLKCYVLMFWVLSLVAQQSSDYTDVQHPSHKPWYLTHSCAIVQKQHRVPCHVARASFTMTIILVLFYTSWVTGSLAYEILEILALRRQRKRTEDMSSLRARLRVKDRYLAGKCATSENGDLLLHEVDLV